MNIGITIDDREIRRGLEALTARLDNLKPVFTKIGTLYMRRVLENFAGERDPEGNAWPRLSAVTLMLQLARNKGFRKGTKTGLHKGALNKAGRSFLQNKMLLVERGWLKDDVKFQATKDGVTIGAGGSRSGDYAAAQQFGTLKAGRGRKTRIPARPFLAMNDGTSLRLALRDKQMIMDVVHQAIGDAIDGKI
jgi:phage gpG-like protein